MKFIMPENEVKVPIKSTSRNLNDRFSIFNMNSKEHCKKTNEILDNGTTANFSHFSRTAIRPFSRTKLFLGFDETLLRPVIIKTPKYRDIDEKRYIVSDYELEEYINFRREMIRAQVHMLNEIRSPLLPEPIDYFEVENTDERIPGHMRRNEPVLVLDYQSGTTVQQYIQKRTIEKAKTEARLENNDELRGRYKKIEAVEIREKFRIIKNVVIFLKELDAKNYAYQGLNTKCILLQRDKTPRFIGLGYICKTKNGYLDENHINYRVCELGYSAPELNNPNIPADKISSKGVSAFSLGVLIHQLVGEYLNIDIETLGEYGHLKYPNDKTTKDIKRSALKGELVHHLISSLCEEDIDKRLTDYDEILNRIEVIIGGRKKQAIFESDSKPKKYDKYVPGVQMIYGDTQIKHCEEDNSVLKDIILGIGFYCRSKSKNLGFINVPGHLCEKCGKAYITEDVYIEEIEATLDEIYNREEIENCYNLELDENGEKEPIYINRKDTSSMYKQVSKMTKVNFNIEECMYDDEKLELFDCAVEYYKIEDKEKEVVGRITTKLLSCVTDSCNKVYISERKLEELKSLLPDRNIYDFDCKDYKEELSVAYKIKRFDTINYCNEDLTKLKSEYVRIPFYVKDNSKPVGYKVMKLNYCSTCKTYYITKQEEKELKARGQKSFKDAFLKIKSQEKRFNGKIYKIQDNTKRCYIDKKDLVKDKVVIYLKKENSKKTGYRILAEVYLCKKCGLYYIKNNEVNRINELAPKGYKIHDLSDVREIPRPEKSDDASKSTPIIRNAKSAVIGENILLCKHDNNKLTRETVNIPKYAKFTHEHLGDIKVENKLYCSKCSRIYLDTKELNEINEKLNSAYIEIDRSININNANGGILKKVNSIVKKFMK